MSLIYSETVTLGRPGYRDPLPSPEMTARPSRPLMSVVPCKGELHLVMSRIEPQLGGSGVRLQSFESGEEHRVLRHVCGIVQP